MPLRMARWTAIFLLFVSALASCETPLSSGEHNVVLNGVRLWYRVAGIQTGQAPLVFLSGGPGYSTYSFEKTIGMQLESHTEMVYLDQRGSGHSERPWAKTYDMPTLVEDVEALRRSLGLAQVSLMGHSFGGTVALEYAAHYPEHVRKLIIVDGAADLPEIFDLWRVQIQQKYPAAWQDAMAGETGKAFQVAKLPKERDEKESCAASKAEFALRCRP